MPIEAHHAILGKFDDNSPTTLEGIVTAVDWRNPHVHIFVNVQDGTRLSNWAVEVESPIDLQQSGWRRDSLMPGDAIRVEGMAARDGSRQAWGSSIVMRDSGRRVLNVTPMESYQPLASRPAPRWPDGRTRLGALPNGVDGYWALPSRTALVEDGVNVDIGADGQLVNVADAVGVAPFQPWARELYEYRQSRFLRDDPMFLNCKPPGGPRQFQLPYGVEFIEDRDAERIFVLVGSGNRNFRIVYLDGRSHIGQVGGDDDNPLYYGRSVGEWEDDTLVLDTRGFNEDFWFSNGGLPHTTQLRMTERFSRPDFDTLTYEVTIDDPGAYTRPWTVSWELQWVSGELPSHFCQENRP
jgi:hypothetical protein